MRKLQLYIAASLDGKIARPDGDVAWLDEVPNPGHDDYGYAAFMQEIDTTLMGHNTYRQLLDFDIPFPYTETDNYVITRDRNRMQADHVTFISGNVGRFVRNLKESEGKNIWLIGGGQVNTLFLNEGLIDELILFVMPVVLGKGIGLFEGRPDISFLELSSHKRYSSGVVRLNYSFSGLPRP